MEPQVIYFLKIPSSLNVTTIPLSLSRTGILKHLALEMAFKIMWG